MIDNGIDLEVTRQELIEDIRILGLDIKKTEFFITHSHPDHCSNTQVLADLDSVIYLGKDDISMLSYGSEERRQRLIEQTAAWGLPDGNLLEDSAFKPVHPMFDFAVKRGWKFNTPSEGDFISAGDYSFICIETPGHTKGHICLYEPQKKILLCGDHVLQNVTPGIMPFGPDENPLADYLVSLDKVSGLDVSLALPSHRSLIPDFQARIREIRHHHDVRLKEILSVLEGRRLNTYQVAAAIHWDVSYGSWEDFPIWQRFMATGEAEAHLRYLAAKHIIRREIIDNRVMYSPA